MGNEESHDLSSNRSAKFVCERNARSHRRSLPPPPLFTYAGSSDRKIIIRRFLQLPSHGQRRSRAFLAYTYVVHTHTVIVCREIIIRHFSPLLYPRQQSQSRPLRRTRVRAGLAACGSHFGARSPGVERYRSVPDRKATGFSPRLIRSFSWFRLFTLLVLLVISPPAINGTTIHSN